ncbi:HIG1 domain family member 2A, mitochondrial [Asbolus verrucosus]|uniref:HIG1 domain family member 2A, mitochondrial n=1 Tax=Asbolus verrucosus TaxID=1661398 RepID=A0A482V7J3_ASBVE|nr:HIG1 domain family member 2A, mitochondrial [Asbolus verrucosus]
MPQGNEEEDMVELNWIKLQDEMDSLNPTETRKEKLYRKISENPLVPIGCLATTAALCYGLWNFRLGNKQMSQYMMRTRIAAQGFTVVALIIGIGLGATQATK